MRLAFMEQEVATIAKELGIDLTGPYRDGYDNYEFRVRVGKGYCVFRLIPEWVRAIGKEDSVVLDVFLDKVYDALHQAAWQDRHWKRRNLEHVR